jgi:seryl-tRNA synthetase
MLHINTIRENTEEIIERLAIKGIEAKALIAQIIATDDNRKKLKQAHDNNLAEGNALAKQIGEIFKSGKKEEAEVLKAKTASLKIEAKELEEQLKAIEADLYEQLVVLPNAPSKQVPFGKTPEDNEVVFTHGVIPDLGEEALPHWELAKKYDLIDFELGVKIAGAGFPVYKGKGARLQRALINFFLDEGLKAGYLEIQPPIVVNEASGFGTGQLPDKEGQMYHVGIDDLYLIPTAEVPITNIYRDVIVKADELPIKNTPI